MSQPDGGTANGNLMVDLMPSGSKKWRFKYRHADKENRLSFGEPAYQRLQRPPLEAGAEGLEQDSAERQTAQDVVDALPEPVIELLVLCNPPPDPDPEPAEL